MFTSRQRGNKGEDAAAKALLKRGYKIIERNFLCKAGEIDIIAKHNEYLIFVEVKLRKNRDFGGGEGAITPFKISHVRNAAQTYLMKKGLDVPVRFDVVTVYGDAQDFKNLKVEVIENAF